MEKLIFNGNTWYSIESIAKILGCWDYCMKYPQDYLQIQEYEFEDEKGDPVYYIKKDLIVEILNSKQNTCTKAKELLESIQKNID